MKIQLFIFGLFAVTTLAHDERESETEEHTNLYHRRHHTVRVNLDNAHVLEQHVGGRRAFSTLHRNGMSLANEIADTETRNDNEGHRHFRHNVEWHRRNGIPLPNERNPTETNNDDENGHRNCHHRHRHPNHHHLHNPEWHKEHGIPMPDTGDNDHYQTTPTPTIRPYATLIPTRRRTTARTTTTRATTPEPDYSREM